MGKMPPPVPGVGKQLPPSYGTYPSPAPMGPGSTNSLERRKEGSLPRPSTGLPGRQKPGPVPPAGTPGSSQQIQQRISVPPSPTYPPVGPPAFPAGDSKPELPVTVAIRPFLADKGSRPQSPRKGPQTVNSSSIYSMYLQQATPPKNYQPAVHSTLNKSVKAGTVGLYSCLEANRLYLYLKCQPLALHVDHGLFRIETDSYVQCGLRGPCEIGVKDDVHGAVLQWARMGSAPFLSKHLAPCGTWEAQLPEIPLFLLLRGNGCSFSGAGGGALPRCGPASHLAEAAPSHWTGGKGVSATGTPCPQGRKALADEGQSALGAECSRDTGERTEPGVTYPGAGGDCDPHAGSCGSQLGSGLLTHSWAWAAASTLLGVPSHPEPQQKLAAYLGQGSGPPLPPAPGWQAEPSCLRRPVCSLGLRVRCWGGMVSAASAREQGGLV